MTNTIPLLFSTVRLMSTRNLSFFSVFSSSFSPYVIGFSPSFASTFIILSDMYNEGHGILGSLLLSFQKVSM
jgi:hypothetical protein